MNKLPLSAEKALQQMYIGKIGDKIKLLEASFDTHSVQPALPFIVRVDGVSFSTFTKGIKKPFDDRLTQSMVSTTIDLTNKFNAYLGYHQSDEISLYFPSQVENTKIPQSHIYSGRVQKLASVIASYASIRLNYHLTTHNWSDLPTNIQQKVLGHQAFFDGRIVPCATTEDAMECLFWRSGFDGLRNAISHIAQTHYSQKTLNGKSVLVMMDMMQQDGINVFKEYNNQILYGTWCKREKYALVGAMNPKTGQVVEGDVWRYRHATGSFNWAEYTPEQRIAFTEAKLWNTEQGHPPITTTSTTLFENSINKE